MGPVNVAPSWAWVGADLAPSLSVQHDVRFVSSWHELEFLEADWLIAVKFPPGLADVERCKRRGTKVLYLPVDYFETEEAITRDAALLSSFDAVAVHTRPLADALTPHARRLAIVEHYGKYALAAPNAFKPEGYVLWVGHRKYVGHLGSWLMAHPIEAPLRILTNVPQRLELTGRSAAVLAKATWYTWSERAQETLFQGAKAGIDIKGTDFSQRTKPPTKAQQFVTSGIPVALNPDSYGFEYFRNLGFDVASPRDHVRWFSEAYWRETLELASLLRARTSKEAVAASYLQILAGA